MARKNINLSLPENVDDYLNNVKTMTGLPKSRALSLLVTRYGDELLQDLGKYTRKEETVKVSTYRE